ncbi:uncharacterized protein Bfra_010177 [Botrytis fragariae]|uniref:Uncharacterized protein n=1 Tax=Botrytis fragariae TaxID=1964551 RepID=A0A8H6EF87_9HELO|nr:uncharacterized protein Bfra_010177 [Botrytis fragariae]KAF5870031.1 hypothetical protein Bfra_010177 [Botrytis fragariae]
MSSSTTLISSSYLLARSSSLRSGYTDGSEVESTSDGNLMLDYHCNTRFDRNFRTATWPFPFESNFGLHGKISAIT